MKEIFKQDAKTLVDLLFDAKVFKDKVTRDHMNSMQDMIETYLSNRHDSYNRIKDINRRLSEKNKYYAS